MCEIAEQQKIIDALNGSSSTLAQILEQYGQPELEDNVSFLALLDEQLFECAERGWWCEQSEARPNDDGDDCCSGCVDAEDE